VARLPDRGFGRERGIIYRESGHAGRWGLVWLDDPWFGPDYCWYSALEDAIIDDGWDGELPEADIACTEPAEVKPPTAKNSSQ